MMKNYSKWKRLRIGIAMTAVLFALASCSMLVGDEGDDDGGSDNLGFKLTGPAADVSGGSAFELSATNTTKTGGALFQWSFSGPGELTYDETAYESGSQFASDYDLSSVTVSAVTNGAYTFTLRVEGRQEYLEKTITVTVSGGAITLTGPIDTATSLPNVVTSGADYVVQSDLELNAALNVDGAGELVIQFDSGAGIIVNDGGVLATVNYQTVFSAADTTAGWKGVLVKNGGEVDLQFAEIRDAGASAFSGYDAAALLLADGANVNSSTSGLKISNQTGLNLWSEVYENLPSGITFSSSTPYSVPLGMALEMEGQTYDNAGETTGTLRGSGGTTIGFGGIPELGQLDNYRITGGAAFGESLGIAGTTGFLMESGTTLSAPELRIWDSAAVTFDGVGSASWNGIDVDVMEIDGTLTVKNGGAAAVSDAFPSVRTALLTDRIYLTGSLIVEDSGGYGVYVTEDASIKSSALERSELSVSGATDAGVSFSARGLDLLSGTLTFDLGTDVAAVEIRQQSMGTATTLGGVVFPSLGSGDYYHVVGSPKFNRTAGSSDQQMTFEAGAHLKFADNKQFEIDASYGNDLVIAGTSDNPVIFEAVNPTQGWAGFLTTVSVDMDYAVFRDGGSQQISGQTDAASFVIDLDTTRTGAGVSIENSTFENSKDWGILIESGSPSVDYTDASFDNTFTDNTTGALEDKNP